MIETTHALVNRNYANWMSTTPNIDQLTVGQMVWPGTHNAGMDWDIGHPFPESVAANWVLCQNHDLLWQMRNGARSFDLRVFLHKNEFKTYHGEVRGRRLDEIIAAANTFLDENPDEFIILDFNTLFSDKKNLFDYQAFERQILRGLEKRLIPYRNSHLTFAQLKQLSPLQRIILPIEYSERFDTRLFWSSLQNKWEGNNFVSTENLAKYITEVMLNPPGSYYPWRLSMTQFKITSGPTKLTKEINAWFDLDSYFLYRASIISVDFFDESRLVEYCIAANQRLVREPHLKRPY